VTESFRLEEGPPGIAALVFDSPGKKVNVFTEEVLSELAAVVGQLAGRRDLGCLLLLSAKPGAFIAGADLEGIARVADGAEAAAASRRGQNLFAAWEALPFPTVAALDGTCVGGGTELALASDYIVVSDRAELRLGLPEVRLGILPGWGGCTRLPERIGASAALDLILSGKTVSGRTALRLGLADALLPAAAFGHLLRHFALGVARRHVPHGKRPGGLRGALLDGNPFGRMIVYGQARRRTLAQTRGHYPAPLAALAAVRAGLESGRRAGFAAEARSVGVLAVSPVCKNLVHVFRLTEGARRRVPADAPEIRAAAVLGAGVMGGGIAQLIAHEAGVPVRLKDISVAALGSGVGHAAELFAGLVARRRLREAEARSRLALLRPALDDTGLGGVDLLVEAIVEKLEVKQQVLGAVSRALPVEAVIASNTSSLPIDAIARDVAGPERVIGMHFFNPVHKMPLVEVVVGTRTSPKVVDCVSRFSRRLGKTPIVVRDGPGFLVNRLLVFSLAEALRLFGEGAPIARLDAAMRAWGMPLGPMELADDVGLDVALHAGRVVAAAFPDRLRLAPWLDAMVAQGRLGSKAGRGFYAYAGRRRKGPDPSLPASLGLPGRGRAPDAASIAERLVLPMVNEAARCLEEGVVASAADLDLAMILGTGFPPFRGGLCRWADGEGLAALGERLGRLAAELGPAFEPAPALERAAAGGGFYTAYPQAPQPVA
jgi:3-hydroxyacyl-CoA dehydrogenase/enoyl-CoA hydratase/3-hydroxybutyryl-CoA epimerase